MSLSIHTNYASLATQNQLGKTNSMLSSAMQRLGTGLRINSAADDAAGLQIATRLQTQSNGQKVGMRNAQDAISMLQTAEGALSEMTSIGQRMKDIATQASNGTNGKAEYDAFNAEYMELAAELSNIMQNTQYGEGKTLLAKELKAADVTAYDNAVKAVATKETALAAAIKSGTGVAAAEGDLKAARDALGKLPIATAVSDAGAFGDKVTFQIGSSASESMEVDASGKLGELATAQAALGHVGDLASAKDAMTKADELLNKIGALRGQFGSSINRLDHTINNLGNMNQNTELSKGRIMDADFASESANMTKNQLLMQSGMSVLGKSNQVGGMVMGLLR